METIMLIHADAAPEFREVDTSAARYALLGRPDEVTYESFGKVRVPLETSSDGLVALSYALMRTFAHPDIVETIKAEGTRWEDPDAVIYGS